MTAYKREGMDPSPYYWYTDQRKWVPPLSYVLFITWMLTINVGMVPPPTVDTVSVSKDSWLGCVLGTLFGIAVCILVSLVVAHLNLFDVVFIYVYLRKSSRNMNDFDEYPYNQFPASIILSIT